MKLIWEIRASIYNQGYYQSLRKKPFLYSLKYYLTLALLLSFVAAFVFLFTLMPVVRPFVDGFGSKILNDYPEDLRVVIKKGQVSTNVAEPYFIKVPEEISQEIEAVNPGVENLFVVDTQSQPTSEQIRHYKTLILLTKESVVYYDRNKIAIQSLGKVADFTLDKGVVSSFLEKIQPYLKFFFPIIVVFVFLIVFTGAILNLLYLVLIALLIWLIARARKIEIGYKKAYQIGLHLMTLALVVDVVLLMFTPRLRVLFLFTAITVVAAIINLKKLPDTEGAAGVTIPTATA